jgi:hypothetical protein
MTDFAGADGAGDLTAPLDPFEDAQLGSFASQTAGFEDDVAASMYPFRGTTGGMIPGIPIADINALQQVRLLFRTLRARPILPLRRPYCAP